MTPELKKKLEACDTLPTPSGIATQIVRLANDANADLGKLSTLLSMDPAITIKVLRLANSPVYARRRRIDNLRQAVIVLGLDAAISLALSFSLLKSWPDPGGERNGIDYPLFWRRSLLAAAIGRILARKVGIEYAEELFLTCLVQDIGMLALDQTMKGLYDGLGQEQVCQQVVIARERERVETDHAAVGGWLLSKWSFPDLITQGVAASHNPERIPAVHENGPFVRSVALSSLIAESFLIESGDRRFVELAGAAENYLGLNLEAFGELLEEAGEAIEDVEKIFETQILAKGDADSILQEAREALMLRTLKSLQVVQNLQDEAAGLEMKTRELEESNKRDGLTKLYNRAYLDQYLESAFEHADSNSEALSLAFVDLDDFKRVNDAYGHQVGDQVLVTTAGLLQKSVRSSDVVARYGGEEFLLVFPGTGPEAVQSICERIVTTFQKTRHDVKPGHKLGVTVSIGIATQKDHCFSTVKEFVGAADKALYRAKLEGRNRSLMFEAVA
ncbi:MAG: diguanylate cyclase [Burkholderiales bacterium]